MDWNEIVNEEEAPIHLMNYFKDSMGKEEGESYYIKYAARHNYNKNKKLNKKAKPLAKNNK
jgi:hypothetical protein